MLKDSSYWCVLLAHYYDWGASYIIWIKCLSLHLMYLSTPSNYKASFQIDKHMPSLTSSHAYTPSYSIESYCFCQDKIIANDWNFHLFHNGTYSEHSVILGHMKLPMGGPHSGRTWQEHIPKLCDHCAHMCHLINLLKTIKGDFTKWTYAGYYNNIILSSPRARQSTWTCMLLLLRLMEKVNLLQKS